MPTITVAVLERSCCPDCGRMGRFSYSPLRHVFACGWCGAECDLPSLPVEQPDLHEEER